jgi:hypothetical protein
MMGEKEYVEKQDVEQPGYGQSGTQKYKRESNPSEGVRRNPTKPLYCLVRVRMLSDRPGMLADPNILQ